MNGVHIAVGVMAIALSAAAALWGAWCWYRVRETRAFWLLLRAAQVVIVIEAALGGVLRLVGHRVSSLHILYGVLPLLVSFIAEQLRVASAQMVLDSRGFQSAQAVGRLPADEQRLVALSIVQRELGVMVLAALVMVGLLARAATTGG